ncbi:unnamed protein product, partial [Ectocarpus sp. 12 AP-2014]
LCRTRGSGWCEAWPRSPAFTPTASGLSVPGGIGPTTPSQGCHRPYHKG